MSAFGGTIVAFVVSVDIEVHDDGLQEDLDV